jgi:predicted GNAT family N-acyltransferase
VKSLTFVSTTQDLFIFALHFSVPSAEVVENVVHIWLCTHQQQVLAYARLLSVEEAYVIS